MEDYPKTLGEFTSRFSTEAACRAYLVQMRWPDGIVCPSCGATKVWETRRGLFVFASGGHNQSVTAGTIFEGTRKPLTMWLRVMWSITSQKTGASALGLQQALGVGTYFTAWTWLHKLRCAMVRPGRDRLCGTIEVNETLIGGVKQGTPGRGAAGKSLVLIAARCEGRRIGSIRLARIPDASGGSLGKAL